MGTRVPSLAPPSLLLLLGAALLSLVLVRALLDRDLWLQVKLGSSPPQRSIDTPYPTTTQPIRSKSNPPQQSGQPTHAFIARANRPSAALSASSSPPHHRGPTTTTMKAAHTFYDFPVSNNGGRCRVVIYDKGIQDQFE
jgi:hypothetical protein